MDTEGIDINKDVDKLVLAVLEELWTIPRYDIEKQKTFIKNLTLDFYKQGYNDGLLSKNN